MPGALAMKLGNAGAGSKLVVAGRITGTGASTDWGLGVSQGNTGAGWAFAGAGEPKATPLTVIVNGSGSMMGRHRRNESLALENVNPLAYITRSIGVMP
jgi:hypothetical protein